MGQQRVASDVEGHAQEHVSAALVQLARQLAVGDVELVQRMTRRQHHVINFAGIPCCDEQATRIRCRPNLVDHLT